MLSRALFPGRPSLWTIVTAISSLSNYFGGAVSTILVPALVSGNQTDSNDIFDVLEYQTIIEGGVPSKQRESHDFFDVIKYQTIVGGVVFFLTVRAFLCCYFLPAC